MELRMLLAVSVLISLLQICLCGNLPAEDGSLEAVVLPAEIVFNDDDISENGGNPQNPQIVFDYDYYALIKDKGDVYDDDLAEFLKQLDYHEEYDYFNNDGASNLLDKLMAESALVDDLKNRFQRDDIPRIPLIDVGSALGEAAEGGDQPVTLGAKPEDKDEQESNSEESNSKEDDGQKDDFQENDSKEDDSKETIIANIVEEVDGEELVYYYDYAQVDNGEVNIVDLLSQDIKNSREADAEEGYYVFEAPFEQDEHPFNPSGDSSNLQDEWNGPEDKNVKATLESTFLAEFGEKYRLLELSIYIGMFLGVLLLVFGWLVCILRLVRVRTLLIQQQTEEQLNQQRKTVKLSGIVKSYARLPVEIRNMKPSNIAYKELYNNV